MFDYDQIISCPQGKNLYEYVIQIFERIDTEYDSDDES